MPRKNLQISVLLAVAACLTFGALAISPHHMALAATAGTSIAAAPAAAMRRIEPAYAPERIPAQATATARAGGSAGGMSSGTKAAIAVLVVVAALIIVAAAYFNQQRNRGFGP